MANVSFYHSILPTLVPSLLSDWWIPHQYHLPCSSMIMHGLSVVLQDWSDSHAIAAMMALVVATLLVRHLWQSSAGVWFAPTSTAAAKLPRRWWWWGKTTSYTTLEDVAMAVIRFQWSFDIRNRTFLDVHPQLHVFPQLAADASSVQPAQPAQSARPDSERAATLAGQVSPTSLRWTSVVGHLVDADAPLASQFWIETGYVYYTDDHFVASDKTLAYLAQVNAQYPQHVMPQQLVTKWELPYFSGNTTYQAMQNLHTIGPHNSCWDTDPPQWWTHSFLGCTPSDQELLQHYDEELHLLYCQQQVKWMANGIYPLMSKHDPTQVVGWWIQTATPRTTPMLLPTKAEPSSSDDVKPTSSGTASEETVHLVTWKRILWNGCDLHDDVFSISAYSSMDQYPHYYVASIDLYDTPYTSISDAALEDLLRPFTLEQVCALSIEGVVPLSDELVVRFVDPGFLELTKKQYLQSIPSQHRNLWDRDARTKLIFLSHHADPVDRIRQLFEGNDHIVRDETQNLYRYHLAYIERAADQQALLHTSHATDIDAVMGAYQKIHRINKWVFHSVLIRHPRNPIMANFDTVISDHIPYLRNIQSKFHSHEAFTQKGQRWFCGILLYGPPGCGKSMLQMAIANEFNRSMLTVDETHLQASQDIYDLLNQSTLNVVVDEEVVRLHILADRCMYVFDEIDRVLVRDGMMGSLLSEIDGLTNHGGRIIVATTNHFDRIPEELCRNGRLYPIPCTLVTPAQAPLFLRPFFEAAAVDAYCPRIEQWIVQERRAPSPALLKQWIQTHLTDLDAVMHAWASMRPLSEEEYAFGFNPALPRPSKLA